MIMTQNLSNIQLELLKTYDRKVSEEDILAIRQFLAEYFAKKAMKLADNIWDKNNWTAEDTQRLISEHHRKS